MASAQCFRCGKGYNSQDLDEIEGDGRCSSCKEFSKRIAFEVDIKMANLRAARGPIGPTRLQLLQEAIKRGGAINVKDLDLKSLNR